MSTEAPLVCRLDALSPADRARHAALTGELRPAARGVQKLPRGYAFQFPDDPALSRHVLEWVALERRCCPFLEFEILLGDEGEPVILRLTGQEGVKEFLAGELALATSRPQDGAPEIDIGSVEPGEEPALLSLLERCGLTETGVRDHLRDALVARDGSRVVGSAILEIYTDGALLRSVAVDSGLRGRGLGVRLTEAALELARHRGMRHVYLLTETASGFFPRFGFHAIPRSDVPSSVAASLEFTIACPKSALVMQRAL